MNKNIVFILDVKLNKEGRYSSTRSLPYQFSIKSWKNWCDKNNCDLFVLNDLLFPIEDIGLCWQRYYLFDILESNNIKYNQILMVDADTIVHPNCPNFFNETDNKLCGVKIEGSYDWIFRSIENYSKYIFNNHKLKWWNYIDCGFILVNQSHKHFFKKITEFYWNNKENLKEIEKLHGGTDQTPFSFLVELENIDIKLFPYQYNMIDLSRKEILRDDLVFTKCGWIYQFNCLPNNVGNKLTYYWMEKTYNELYKT
jgi:hypothetical protein